MNKSISKILTLFVLTSMIFAGTSIALLGLSDTGGSSIGFSKSPFVPESTLTGLHIRITPDQSFEYTGESYHIFVNSTQGYSNYSAIMYLSANDVKGMTPSSAVAKKSSIGYFEFNLTAPSIANQTVYGLICVKATYNGTPVSTSASFNSNIYDPVTLYGSVTNTGSVEYHNVPVGFYINGGKALGTITVKTLPADTTKVVNLTIPSNLVSAGENTLEVAVVVNSTQSYSGIGKYTENFYYGHPPNYSWFYYIVAIVVIFMVFLTVTSATGRRTKQPKWRTRKSKDKKISKK